MEAVEDKSLKMDINVWINARLKGSYFYREITQKAIYPPPLP
jgi:hypothetical protein